MGRRSGVVAAVGGVAAVAVAGAAWGGGGSKDYPGALPGAKTNVSSGRTLADHGVSLPPGYSDFRYSSFAGDSYPLFAIFRLPCSDSGAFVVNNQLGAVSQLDIDGELDTFSAGEGWSSASPTTWYSRRNQGSVDAMDAMVADAGHGVCRVYLLSGEAMGPSAR
jgi:hypothetical protein